MSTKSMNNLRFIIGGRLTGKSTELAKWYVPNKYHVVITPNFPMLDNLKNKLMLPEFHMDFNYLLTHHLKDVGRGMGGANTVLLGEEIQSWLTWEQDWFFELVPHVRRAVVTLTPEVINPKNPPPYWKYIGQTNVTSLSTDKTEYWKDRLPEIKYLTEVKGYFLIDPSEL